MRRQLFTGHRSELDFILTRLRDVSAAEYLRQEKFARFMDLTRAGNPAPAAKEYRDVTGAALSECLIAYRVARDLLR